MNQFALTHAPARLERQIVRRLAPHREAAARQHRPATDQLGALDGPAFRGAVQRPTLAAQYVLKDVVLLAAGFVVAASMLVRRSRPGDAASSPSHR